MVSTRFPFEPVPRGEVSPGVEAGHWYDLVQRDWKVIRWFVEEEMGLEFRPSPLRDLCDKYQAVDRDAPAPALEELDRDTASFGLHITTSYGRLAWAVRALYGADAVDQIHASFVRDELLGADTKQRSAEYALPAGVGTMMLAARLTQAGGGRVTIHGSGVAGHDIRWITRSSDVVLVERKDRSYDAGLRDSPEKRVRRVQDEVRNSKIPTDAGACRILSVGFQHLVTARADAGLGPPLRTWPKAVQAVSREETPAALRPRGASRISVGSRDWFIKGVPPSPAGRNTPGAALPRKVFSAVQRPPACGLWVPSREQRSRRE